MLSKFGIIGFPLTHTFSPAYFRKKFAELGIGATYEAYSLATISEFPALLEANVELVGLSVTIPYKEAIIKYMEDLDDVAREVGAVNCIAINNGVKKGYNTDVIGFSESLNPLLQRWHTHALILGTGGASKAVAWVLGQLGIRYQKVSRTRQDGCLTYDELTSGKIAECRLIINTTPLGMYPHVDTAAEIPYDGAGSKHLFYDLVYNPAETKFLSLGIARGATIKNGFEMLQLQAEAAWKIWSKQL
jgi:shikimate dehydrogenase